MGLPKKGTRTIVVGGVRYRFVGHGWRGEGENFCEVTAELADEPRAKIRAHYTFTHIQAAYRAIGHALSHVIDTIPPYVVRQSILIALEQGWKPDAGGGLRDLGNLDEVIDFSALNPDSQDPGRTSRNKDGEEP